MMRMILLLLALFSAPALANGIDFSKIAVGTRFIYGTAEDRTTRLHIYQGKEDDLHKVDAFRMKPNGTVGDLIERQFYDPQGRMVRLEYRRPGSAPQNASWQPYLCFFSEAASCTHFATVTHLAENGRQTRRRQQYAFEQDGNARRIFQTNDGVRRWLATQTRDERGWLIALKRRGRDTLFLLSEEQP